MSSKPNLNEMYTVKGREVPNAFLSVVSDLLPNCHEVEIKPIFYKVQKTGERYMTWSIRCEWGYREGFKTPNDAANY